MSTVDDATELEEKVGEFARVARAAYNSRSYGGEGGPWEGLHPTTRYAWCLAADAVLDRYDPEWQSVKAGM